MLNVFVAAFETSVMLHIAKQQITVSCRRDVVDTSGKCDACHAPLEWSKYINQLTDILALLCCCNTGTDSTTWISIYSTDRCENIAFQAQFCNTKTVLPCSKSWTSFSISVSCFSYVSFLFIFAGVSREKGNFWYAVLTVAHLVFKSHSSCCRSLSLIWVTCASCSCTHQHWVRYLHLPICDATLGSYNKSAQSHCNRCCWASAVKIKLPFLQDWAKLVPLLQQLNRMVFLKSVVITGPICNSCNASSKHITYGQSIS